MPTGNSSELSVARLHDQADLMSSIFFDTGEMEYLQAASECVEDAFRIVEDIGHYSLLPEILLRRANILHHLCQMTGRSEDLRHALDMYEQAYGLYPRDQPFWLRGQVDLATRLMYFGKKHEREEEYYRGRAVQILTKALSADTQAFSNWDRLKAEGTLFYFKGEWEQAVKILRKVIANANLQPRETKVDMADLYNVLVHSLLDMREAHHSRGEKELERIILDNLIVTVGRYMDFIRNPDLLIEAQSTLGTCLSDRWRITGNADDLKAAQRILLDGFRNPAGTPIYRFSAGALLINNNWRLDLWSKAAELCKELVDLVVIENGRFLVDTDKQHWTRYYSDQISGLAAVALNARIDLLDVINMLETWRGSILGHMIDNRTDLDDLRKEPPSLADRIAALRDEMNTSINAQTGENESTGARMKKIVRRRTAENEMSACLEKVRTLEGFDRFLRGPSQSELRGAAAHGPIVIVLILEARSDAIIVTKNNDLVHVPLPELYSTAVHYQAMNLTVFSNIVELGEKNKLYLQLLQWLWNDCVKIIFENLRELVPETAKLRLWWLGIGIAATLPFHAAGIYTGKKRESALSQAISSYTPSLKFLMHGRRNVRKKPPEADAEADSDADAEAEGDSQCLPKRPDLLMVTMPSTPGMENLEGTLREAETVKAIVGDSYSVQHMRHPSAEQVKQRMKKCDVVHFACHGRSVLRTPLSSHLVLQTTNQESEDPVIEKLTISSVAALNLSHGKLAFLSACSTAENLVEDGGGTLLDESLHLAAGFWVAGFLHTVGNLWHADDSVSIGVVDKFYRHLVRAEFGNGENVAVALNEALLSISASRSRQPLTWAQFVHFGVW